MESRGGRETKEGPFILGFGWGVEGGRALVFLEEGGTKMFGGRENYKIGSALLKYCPNYIGVGCIIIFLHSNVSRAKSSNKLHIFRCIITTTIDVLFDQPLLFCRPSACIEKWHNWMLKDFCFWFHSYSDAAVSKKDLAFG